MMQCVYPAHSISNRKLCCFSCIRDMVHQNSKPVELWWEKTYGNLRMASIEPSMDLRMANREPAVHFRRDNTETY